MRLRSADRVDLRRRRLLGTGAAGLAALAATPFVRAAPRAPVVRTRAGRVRGIIDGDLQVFRGIRYGRSSTTPSSVRSIFVKLATWVVILRVGRNIFVSI